MRSKLLLIASLLTLLIALPAGAQVQIFERRGADPAVQRDGTAPVFEHISDAVNRTPEARAALADFHRRKALGLLPRGRKRLHAVGDTVTFKVRNRATGAFEDIDFELMTVDEADPPRFQLWVELAERDNGTVTDDDIAALVQALGAQTPGGSINPNAGILEISETIFGDPPDVDGDGITDVLLLDIRDTYNPPAINNAVSGFVSGADLSDEGNNRDILYLDTNPTLTVTGIGRVAQTAAHEYQHLIHLNYDLDELTFINEALSEWGEVACGFAAPMTYLEDADRYNVPLYRFSLDSVSERIDDRQRGRLFIHYIADRFGPLEAGTITRQDANGTDGLRNSLVAMNAGLSVEDLLLDFHTANFVNDIGFDRRYGYTSPLRRGLRAVESVRFDGRLASETPSTGAAVNPGGVYYAAWDQVADFTLTLDVAAGGEDLRVTALLFRGGSIEEDRLLDLSTDTFTFDGAFDRVVLVMAHVNPDAAQIPFSYAAAWTLNQLVGLLPVQYDNGRALEGQFFAVDPNIFTTPSFASRFVVPFADRATVLDKVFLAPYFANQFIDQNGNPLGPPDAPRDLTLYVWGPGTDGRPDAVLFSLDVDDPRPYTLASLNLNFFEVDLAPFASALGTLPDTIFVGYTEAGTDPNILVTGVSPYRVENVSFVGDFQARTWTALWGLQLAGGTVINEGALPIRAQFAVPTATALAPPAETPNGFVLHPNFPNPFNPITTIAYDLPQHAEVRLAVYDVLGREVAVLVEAMQPAGRHEVTVDARAWASGLYVYTVEAAGQRQTRRMVLVK